MPRRQRGGEFERSLDRAAQSARLPAASRLHARTPTRAVATRLGRPGRSRPRRATPSSSTAAVVDGRSVIVAGWSERGKTGGFWRSSSRVPRSFSDKWKVVRRDDDHLLPDRSRIRRWMLRLRRQRSAEEAREGPAVVPLAPRLQAAVGEDASARYDRAGSAAFCFAPAFIYQNTAGRQFLAPRSASQSAPEPGFARRSAFDPCAFSTSWCRFVVPRLSLPTPTPRGWLSCRIAQFGRVGQPVVETVGLAAALLESPCDLGTLVGRQ